MKQILRTFILYILVIYLLSELISGFKVNTDPNTLIIAALLLFIFLNIIKPVVNIVMLPVNLITLNLSVWISDIILLFIWTVITPGISTVAWDFPGTKFGPLTLGALYLSSWQVSLLCCILLTLILKLFNWLCK